MAKKESKDQVIKRGILIDPENSSSYDFDYISKCVDFVILKARAEKEKSTSGAWNFKKVYEICKAKKIKVGVYYECRTAVSDKTLDTTITDSVLAEAENLYKYNLYSKDPKRQFEYPIYIGLQKKEYFYKNQNAYKTIISGFNEYLASEHQYWIGFYVCRENYNYIATISNSCLTDNDKITTDYAFWVADYNANYNTYIDKVGMWEFNDKEVIMGINSNCYMSYCFIDYPDLMKENHRNGYTN